MKQGSSFEQRLQTVTKEFDYFLNASVPPITCLIDYIYDKQRELFYCQFELLRSHYKCPFGGNSKTESYKIACLHYLFTKEAKMFPVDPPIPFDSYFNEYQDNLYICPFDIYKSTIVFNDTKRSDVEALSKLISELREGDYESVGYTNDLVNGKVTVMNRFGSNTLSPSQNISKLTNDEKKKVLARTAAEYLLSVEARLH